jgi:hypothetical protein
MPRRSKREICITQLGDAVVSHSIFPRRPPIQQDCFTVRSSVWSIRTVRVPPSSGALVSKAKFCTTGFCRTAVNIWSYLEVKTTLLQVVMEAGSVNFFGAGRRSTIVLLLRCIIITAPLVGAMERWGIGGACFFFIIHGSFFLSRSFFLRRCFSFFIVGYFFLSFIVGYFFLSRCFSLLTSAAPGVSPSLSSSSLSSF